METLEHDEKLKYLTGLVIEAADYFKENCNIFHKTRNFVFISNIDKENQIILDELGHPFTFIKIVFEMVMFGEDWTEGIRRNLEA